VYSAVFLHPVVNQSINLFVQK